jgi:hypothetical protein
MVLNWRSNFSNLPSAATGRRKTSEPKKTACLREPVFATVLAYDSSLGGCCRGVFFITVSNDLTGGSQVAVVVWRFWKGI